MDSESKLPLPSAISAEELAEITARVASARESSIQAARRAADRLDQVMVRQRRFGQAAVASEVALTELQSSVRGYATALKATNTPPEKTLVLLKQILDTVDVVGDEKEMLTAAIVGWMLDTYYVA